MSRQLRFHDEALDEISSAADWYERHLARFPYVIVFVEVGEEIRVIAVMHARRQPGYGLGRLET